MFEIEMKSIGDGCRKDEFFWQGVVGVVLDEEFFEEAFMFFKGVFLFVGECSFVYVEEHEVDGVVLFGIVDDVFVVGAVSLDVLAFLEMLYSGYLVA